jgi:serine/threonine protein kinase
MKLDNMLLFENGEVKIADFGLAKKAGEKQGELKLEGLLFILHLNQSTTMNTSRGLILGLLAVLLLRW